MKNWILIFAIAFGFAACNSDAPSSSETTLPAPPNRDVPAPSALSSVFSPKTGVLRGVDFSMNRDAIAAAESAAQVETSENSLMYTLDLNETEFVDVVYYFNNNQLEEIEIDVYAADLASVDAYYAQLVDYFNSKYLSRGELWDGSVNDVPFTAFAQKIDTPENPGVIVFYEKMDAESAALYEE